MAERYYLKFFSLLICSRFSYPPFPRSYNSGPSVPPLFLFSLYPSPSFVALPPKDGLNLPLSVTCDAEHPVYWCGSEFYYYDFFIQFHGRTLAAEGRPTAELWPPKAVGPSAIEGQPNRPRKWGHKRMSSIEWSPSIRTVGEKKRKEEREKRGKGKLMVIEPDCP